MPRSRTGAPGEVAAAPASPARRRRIKPEERTRDIVQKAVELFSEAGFGGSTRELAQRLGVTQPLLYRYFPSKDDLIRAIYQKIYVDRWDPCWGDLLDDESRPLKERLQAFYESYTDAIFTREWLRVYLFAGLRGEEINRWYIGLVEDQVLKRIVRGIRHEFGLPQDLPVSDEELELFWILHGGIFYYGVRRYIYGLRVAEDKAWMIANALDTFLAGARTVLCRIPVASGPAAAKSPEPSPAE